MDSRFRDRRDAFVARIQGGVALIPAGHIATRNADNQFAFRQNSDFHYLTGFDEPDAVLVLAPQCSEEASVLFLRPLDREAEIWMGRRLGVEAAPAALGVAAAFPRAELAAKLPDSLVGAETLYYELGRDEALDRTVLAALAEAKHRVRRGGTAPRAIVEPGTVLHELRLRKSPEELDLMRRAAAASAAGYRVAMSATRPGMGEGELEAILEYQYRLAGAHDVAYPSIVAGGANATILHYLNNCELLRDGDLVLVDSGAELDLYASDVSRTWPVNGRFRPEQRALYEIVLRAQLAAIERVRAGEPVDAYHRAAVRMLTEGLCDLGLLSGSLDELIESEASKPFYPHRTGHFLGLDVHDVGRYTQADGSFRAFEPGMVVTVEPGLYVQPDAEVPERWRGIGIRIEDDVLCTSGEPETLTAAIPKRIADLEALVGSAALARSGR
ncbi:MAG: aminopeptidase P N-terminal domain-containing protein [Vulcanimicrobiaceae bacterium]